MGLPAPAGVAASGLPPQGDQANAVLSGAISAVGPSAPFAFRGPMNLFIWASVATPLTTTAGSLTASVGSGTGIVAGSAVNSVNVPKGTTWGAFSGTSGTLAIPPVTWPGVINTQSAGISNLPSTEGLLGATVTVPSTVEGVTLPAGTTVIAIIQPAVAPSGNSPGVLGVVQLSAKATAAPNLTGPVPFVFARNGNAITVSGADAAATFTGAPTFNATIQLERSFDGGATFLPCNVGGGGQLAQWTGTAVTPISITFGEPEKNILYRLNCLAYTSGTINYRISQTGGAAESLAIGPLSSG